MRDVGAAWLGDDTPLGWAVTVAYAIGALVTFAAARRVRAPAALARSVLGSALLLLALGVNKQLDLQRYVFGAGRRLTFALGLYDHRDALHIAFPIVVGLVLVGVGAYLVRALRPHLPEIAPILAAFALFAAFVVVRVALFSHLSRVLGWTWLESEAPAFLELVAIALVAVGAQRLAQRRGAADEARP